MPSKALAPSANKTNLGVSPTYVNGDVVASFARSVIARCLYHPINNLPIIGGHNAVFRNILA